MSAPSTEVAADITETTLPAAAPGADTNPAVPSNESAGDDLNEDVTTTPEPVTQEEVVKGLEEMTPEQLEAVESGDKEAIRTSLGLDKTPPPSAPTATETPKPPDDAPAPNRISVKGLPEEDRVAVVKAINAVRAGEYKSVPEALAALGALPVTPQASPAQEPPAATPPAQQQEQAPAEDPKVADIKTRLADLEEKRRAARTEYDYATSEDLTIQITDLKMELRDAEQAAAAYQQQAATWTQQEDASRNRALGKYSELFTADTDFANAIEDEIILAEAKGDHIMGSPDWPEKIADRVYGKLQGKGGAQSAPQQPEATPDIPPAPKPGIRLPGSPVSSGTAAPPMTPAMAMEAVNGLTPEQEASLLAELEKRTGYA